MTKRKSSDIEHEFGRGKIQDNLLKAAVTSPLFKTRTEKPKKGKGSYNRKGHKLKGYAPFDFPALKGIFCKKIALENVALLPAKHIYTNCTKYMIVQREFNAL